MALLGHHFQVNPQGAGGAGGGVSIIGPVETICLSACPLEISGPLGQTDSFSSIPVVLADDQVGTCGNPAVDVLTIQGCEGMTPISVTGVEVDIGEVSITNLNVMLPVGTCGDPISEVLTVQGCGGGTPVSITGNVGRDDTQGIDVDGVQQWEGDWVDGDNTLLWDTDLTGGATATDDLTESARDMNVTTASGDKVIVQARQRQLYLLGRTKRIIIGALMGAKKADVRKRIGFFDADDGIFFEQDGTDLKVVTRTSASGAPIDSPVIQSAWNLDPLDGTGPSGLTLDETKINFFIIEYDWHGAGKVNFGFRIDGRIRFVHAVDFANVVTLPYIQRPTLPVRCEIENTGVTGSATTMKAYSASVVNFSGLASLHLDFSADNTAAGTVVDTTLTPVVSIRLGSGFEKNLLRVQGINLFTGSGNTIRWALIFNGALTGAAFASVDPASIAEFDITATVLTGGVQIASGFFDNNNGVLASAGFFNLLFLSSNIAGTADIVTLAAQRDSGVATVNASMIFEEYKR